MMEGQERRKYGKWRRLRMEAQALLASYARFDAGLAETEAKTGGDAKAEIAVARKAIAIEMEDLREALRASTGTEVEQALKSWQQAHAEKRGLAMLSERIGDRRNGERRERRSKVRGNVDRRAKNGKANWD